MRLRLHPNANPARVAGATGFACATACAGLLLGGCMSPRPPHGMPDASVIGVTQGGHAIAPACKALIQPSGMVDAGQARPGVAFGCATYTNLAAMIARPADLVTPRPYAGGSSALATGAVRRHEEGRIAPLDASPTAPAPAGALAAPGARSY